MVMTLVPLFVSAPLLIGYWWVLDHKKDNKKFKKKLASKFIVPDELKTSMKEDEINIARRVFACCCDDERSDTIDEDRLSKVLQEFEGCDKSESEAKSAQMIKSVASNGQKITFKDLLTNTHQTYQEADEFQAFNFVALFEKIAAKEMRSKGQDLFYAFLFLTFLVMSSTSATLFQYVVAEKEKPSEQCMLYVHRLRFILIALIGRFLKCHTFEVPGEGSWRYLFQDYSIDCDSARYQHFRVYAFAMILVCHILFNSVLFQELK